MPFPHHDRAWVETARFLAEHVQPGELLIAPDEFVEQFPSSHSYSASFAPFALSYPWAVIHKGMLSRISRSCLTELDEQRTALFANDVFVIFSEHKNFPNIAADSPHLKAFRQMCAQLSCEQNDQPIPETKLKPHRDGATP